jgi:hypothetical protein
MTSAVGAGPTVGTASQDERDEAAVLFIYFFPPDPPDYSLRTVIFARRALASVPWPAPCVFAETTAEPFNMCTQKSLSDKLRSPRDESQPLSFYHDACSPHACCARLTGSAYCSNEGGGRALIIIIYCIEYTRGVPVPNATGYTYIHINVLPGKLHI